MVIVRHGESVRNLSCDEARVGRPELLERQLIEEKEEELWPLTEEGHRQAQTSGTWIASRYGLDFNLAICSPFVRTRQTAEGLGLGLTWEEDARLREREWGDYCAAGFETYTVNAYLDDLAQCGNFEWRTHFPGGESLADLVPRCREFFYDLIKRQSEGRVVLVSHGGAIRALQLVIERLPIEEHPRLPGYRLSNCCVMQYRLHDVDPVAQTWKGESSFAQPALPHQPETNWIPIGGVTP